MEYFRAQDTYLVRLDPEEEILTQLHALAEKERIQLAEVSGLGALKEFEICVYNVAEKAFYHNAYTEALELVSLSGTITQLDGNPYLHIHAAAGDSTSVCKNVSGCTTQALCASGRVFTPMRPKQSYKRADSTAKRMRPHHGL